jgi:hypothetical protein
MQLMLFTTVDVIVELEEMQENSHGLFQDDCVQHFLNWITL